MTYVAILGRQPALGLAELEACFGAEAVTHLYGEIALLEFQRVRQAQLFHQPDDPQRPDRLLHGRRAAVHAADPAGRPAAHGGLGVRIADRRADVPLSVSHE